jgi:hypothetical protein
MLSDETVRLQHTDLPAATDCAALVDRIDALVWAARFGRAGTASGSVGENRSAP